MDYREFLQKKTEIHKSCGFDCSPDEVNPIVKPHQRDCIVWAVRGGTRALFESFGLGKTIQQLEIIRIILNKLGGGRGLVVAPLGVRAEFMHDAAMLGITIRFIRFTAELHQQELLDAGSGIWITNYESIRDGRLDPNLFDVVSLDEASVLRGFGGSKTFREFMALFAGDRKTLNARTKSAGVQYRFVATATPSPNEYIELLAYAAFLGIMDVSGAKTRFFKRDSTKADQLTLHAHKEKEFWNWCASWAIFLQSPADLGYSSEGYDMPDMNVQWHECKSEFDNVSSERDGQGRLFRSVAIGVSDASREKRESMGVRIDEMMRIVNEDRASQWVIWVDLNDEQKAVEAALDAVGITYSSLYGADDIEAREPKLIEWKEKKTTVFLSKPSMYGAGVNLQQCHNMIFAGIGFRFYEVFQAIHRVHRFLQTHACNIHFIYTEAEREIRKTLERKWAQHEELVAQMTGVIREFGLSDESIRMASHRAMGVERIEVEGKMFRIINNDCVDETRRMESNSAGLILTSIPFSTQYEYSPNFCYDEQTQVLTKRGWLSFGDILMDDQLATMNLESREIQWQVPQRIVWMPYSGPMLRFWNRSNFDLLVTPDHKLIVDARVGNHISGRKEKHFGGITADKVAAGFVQRKWRMINAANPGAGLEPTAISLPLIPDGARGPKRKPITSILAEDFMELAGWYLSEGYCDALNSKHAGRISLAQCHIANSKNTKTIMALVERIGLNARYEPRQVVAHNKGVAAFLLQQFGAGSHFKRIPRWVKDLHPRLLTILRDTMMKGDGNKDGFAYASVSTRLLDDFQEICLLTGWRATVKKTIVGIGRKQLFPEIREKPETIKYQGMVGCATVHNGTLVVRRNGTMCISGNCDFGHTDNNEHFFQQMDYLTPELLRVLQPGRMCCIHVKDRIVPGGMTGLGFQVVYPFHAKAIDHYTRHGFAYMGMKTIVTDVVRENNQTYRLGWTEQCKDGTKMGVGMPEYLLLFRKPPTETVNSYADLPVVKDKAAYSRSRWQIDAHAFARSSGNRLLTPDDLKGKTHAQIFRLFRQHSMTNVYDFEEHVKLGEALEAKGILPVTFMLLQPQSYHPDVWTDITRMLTLNGAQSAKGKEMHLCPMQIDLAYRVIEQMSMPGETVFDPFNGLGTVSLCAVEKGRYGLGVELSTPYFYDSVYYMQAAERKAAIPTLFDAMAMEDDPDPLAASA